MFKAIVSDTGEEIITLHPRWRERLAELRRLDRAGRLVCQGCRQQVRLKAGKVKRPHFAHQHLAACSYGSESPGVLLARAVLYHWLVMRFGEHAVTVEFPLQGLPRPVDCWVKTETGSLAYWVVDAGIKLEPRISILQTLESQGISAVFVFTHDMLHLADPGRLKSTRGEKEPMPGQAQRRLIELGRKGRLGKPGRLELAASGRGLLLSPTERALVRFTPYDIRPANNPVEQERWGSLYYLDADGEILLAYRSLVRVHKPNWFEGTARQAALSEWEVNRATGDFVYPGETRRLAQLQRLDSRLARKKQQHEQRLAAQESPGLADALQAAEPHPVPGEEQPSAPRLEPQPPTQRWTLQVPQRQVDPLPCVSCGQITTDYWSTFFLGDKKVCRCRDCLNRTI